LPGLKLSRQILPKSTSLLELFPASGKSGGCGWQNKGSFSTESSLCFWFFPEKKQNLKTQAWSLPGDCPRDSFGVRHKKRIFVVK
jgi:hypothetical protein